jgi:hypothetical protein
LRFRSPAEVHRSTPAPSRRPEGLHVGRCFLSWTFAPYDTCRDSGSAFHGASGPAACHVRGFDTPIAAYTVVPPDAFRRRSVPRLHPSRPSPRRDPGSSRSPMPSWRCPRRFASPPCGACGRGRLQGFDPATGSFCPSESRRTRRADAFLGFIPPEHSLPPALASALCRGGSPRTHWAVQRLSPPASQGLQARKDRLAPLGATGSHGFSSPCDPHGRLAADGRPSLGVARRSGDTNPTSPGWTSVPPDPHGVSTPSGHSRGRASRAGLRRTGAPLALSLSFRGPSRHPRTVPRTRRPARRTMLPPLGFPALRHMTGRRTRLPRGFRPRCVPRPGFDHPHRGFHRRPSRRLSAPERP